MKKYRFFYHYNKIHKKISVHYRDKCYLTDNIKVSVETESHWNKQQPRLVIRGFSSNVSIEENSITIQ
jgi:hypothetical protein